MNREFAWGEGVSAGSTKAVKLAQCTEELSNLPLQTIAEQIRVGMSCPIDWSMKKEMAPVEQILLEKWYYIISDAMPSVEYDAQYLRGADGTYLSKPSELSSWADLLEPNAVGDKSAYIEAKQIALDLFCFREEIKNKYELSCKRLFNTRAQAASERPKHYALGAKNCDEVRQISLTRQDIGIMLPSLTCRVQELALWRSMLNLFEDRMREHRESNEDDFYNNYRTYFDHVWDEYFCTEKSYGLSLNALDTVGYYNGQSADWLIFDISFQSNIFHCYPSIIPSPGLPMVCADDLQGLNHCLDEGYEFGYPLHL